MTTTRTTNIVCYVGILYGWVVGISNWTFFISIQSYQCNWYIPSLFTIPDSKVHGANMGPIWGRQDPCGPHEGPMNRAIWDVTGISINKFCDAVYSPKRPQVIDYIKWMLIYCVISKEILSTEAIQFLMIFTDEFKYSLTFDPIYWTTNECVTTEQRIQAIWWLIIFI